MRLSVSHAVRYRTPSHRRMIAHASALRHLTASPPQLHVRPSSTTVRFVPRDAHDADTGRAAHRCMLSWMAQVTDPPTPLHDEPALPVF